MRPSQRLRDSVRFALPALVWAVAFSAPASAQQQTFSACGPLANAYGPYDYRVDRGNTLAIVENVHFTTRIEQLAGGETGSVGSELDYTLRAFPNHHRALIALVRLGKKAKSVKPTGLNWTIECYFDRALRFRPDDTTVRMLYANFLFENSRSAEGNAQLERTAMLAADNPFTHYNVGLIYFEQRNFDKALEEAGKAYSLGFQRPELRDKLKAAGKWNDAVVQTGSAAAPATPAASAAASAPQQRE